MERPGRLIVVTRILWALLLALVLAPGVAAACVIDNTASLSANGVRATPTTAAPSGAGPWAQFTVGKAFASGAPVQFAELHSDLVRSLAPAPGGEWMLDVQRRMAGLIERLRRERPERRIALVGHGDPIKAALLFYLGMPLDHVLRIELGTGSVSRLEVDDDGARLLRLDEVRA